MMQKAFSFFGILLAIGVLAVSVMRASERSAYAFVVSDEVREHVVESQVSWWERGQMMKPGSVAYRGRAMLGKMRMLTTTEGEERARLYMQAAETRRGDVETLMADGDLGLAMKTAAKGTGYLLLAEEELNNVVVDKELWGSLHAAAVEHKRVLDELEQHAHDGEGEVIRGLCGELQLVREKAEAQLNG